jgi:hypothetical protein
MTRPRLSPCSRRKLRAYKNVLLDRATLCYVEASEMHQRMRMTPAWINTALKAHHTRLTRRHQLLNRAVDRLYRRYGNEWR